MLLLHKPVSCFAELKGQVIRLSRYSVLLYSCHHLPSFLDTAPGDFATNIEAFVSFLCDPSVHVPPGIFRAVQRAYKAKRYATEPTARGTGN